ncbi:MAG: hypothetical protein HY534_04530 [Chloroflexi bacterium]|nr:hypothetical protein [Chloroflexota bacterium]
MLRDVRGRMLTLLLGGVLIALAMGIRLWLAWTGSYSEGGEESVIARVLSAVALLVGFALAGVAVAWPMRTGGRHGPG